MKIGNFDLEREILLVAELGNNHEGNFGTAVEMISAAAQAGAHAVKFQTIRPEKLVASSQTERLNKLKSFEFSDGQFQELARIASEEGVMFMSTPFSLDAADMLAPLVPCFKIASGDLDFFPLIRRVCTSGKPVVLSCGCADTDTVRNSVDFVKSHLSTGAKPEDFLALLHCTVSYPTPPEQANLRTIPYLRHEFKLKVGYSDHTIGIDAAFAAAALGARIIEKHFTLDKNFSSFRDHQLSADPGELGILAKKLRELNPMLGVFGKPICECEKSMISQVRRSIAAASPLKKGHVLREKDLCWTRPATGLRPGQEGLAIGKTLLKDLGMGETISTDILS
ncbi:MAG: hypothetical protein A2X49_05575 [Lentisphaerae bacterium GWF2_52_8]|nr:MAG: hypothetical protein A2X49_05575 [Lentisphaerae bacterium GWF2_52_8]